MKDNICMLSYKMSYFIQFHAKGHYKMDNINRKAEKKINNLHRVIPVLQAVFPNPDELELVKKAAGGRGKVSKFLREAAVEKAKKIDKKAITTSLS